MRESFSSESSRTTRKTRLSLPKLVETETTPTFSASNLLKASAAARVKRRKLASQKAGSETTLKPAESVNFGSKASEVHVVLSESDDEQTDLKHTSHKQADSETTKQRGLDMEIDLFQHDFPKSKGKGPRSSIRFLCDLSEPNQGKRNKANVDTLSLGNIIGVSDLLETYQFNFSVQLPVFLPFLHDNFLKEYRKIVFITGGTVFESPEMRDAIRMTYNVSEAVAPLPSRFASHHSKMMVNLFENGEVEIVILTSNLMQIDVCGLTQAVWKSGRLGKGTTTTTQGKRFRLDLLRYLAKYGLSVTKKLIVIVEKLDFSVVDVELVASAPGIYDIEYILSSGEYYGYAKFRQVLQRNNLLVEDTNTKHKILAQVTSIAYPYTSQKGNTSSVFSHVLCPLMFDNWQKDLLPGLRSFENHQQFFNYTPRIIFPSKKDIAQSSLGYRSGAAIHFKYEASTIHRAQYEQNVKRYLCKWGTSGDITGRESTTPHVKYYACDNGDDWKLLKWVMVGSHNLSKQAWGYPKANSGGKKMDVSSYELSVLIPLDDSGKLVPVYRKDTLDSPKGNTKPLRFPFVLPPVPYDKTDEPWSMESTCRGMRDRWGNTHP